MRPFEQITVAGVGLLGGSLAAACRSRGLAQRIVGFGRNPDHLEKARELDIVDSWTTDPAEAVRGADLVVLCTPVGTFGKLVRQMAPALSDGCILTDVGSVKGSPVAEIETLLPGTVHYVGAHPVAGSEKSGIGAAGKDLLQGALCIVTPGDNTPPEARERVTEFWKAVGMTVEIMSREEHDYILGAVSHLPHIVAFALMNTVAGMKTGNRGGLAHYCGNGLKDITRIAASDPVMWRDISVANKTALLGWMDQFEMTLGQLRQWIENGDGEKLEKAFADAHRNRIELA